jgi:hypothetical protein
MPACAIFFPPSEKQHFSSIQGETNNAHRIHWNLILKTIRWRFLHMRKLNEECSNKYHFKMFLIIGQKVSLHLLISAERLRLSGSLPCESSHHWDSVIEGYRRLPCSHMSAHCWELFERDDDIHFSSHSISRASRTERGTNEKDRFLGWGSRSRTRALDEPQREYISCQPDTPSFLWIIVAIPEPLEISPHPEMVELWIDLTRQIIYSQLISKLRKIFK